MTTMKILNQVADADKQSGDVCAMAYYDDKLFTGAEGGKLIVYNPDLTVNKVIQAQYNTINDICIFNDKLVTTGNDGLIKLWNLSTWEVEQTLSGHENEVRVLFPTQDRLYSGDMDGKVKIWNKEGSCDFTLSTLEEVWHMAVCGKVIYTTRHTDVTCTEVEFKPIREIPTETEFVILDTFPGKGPLAIAGHNICYCTSDGIKILIKEHKTGHPDAGSLDGHNRIINAMVADRETLLYTASYDCTVKMWDLNSKKLLATGNTLSTAAFSLAVHDEDGSIYAGLGGGNIVRMSKH